MQIKISISGWDCLSLLIVQQPEQYFCSKSNIQKFKFKTEFPVEVQEETAVWFIPEIDIPNECFKK